MGEPGTGASFEQQWALDEAFSDLVVAFNRAVERVMLAPAPDLAALAAKVALAVDEQAWELPEGEAAMARLRADSVRLCGGATPVKNFATPVENRVQAVSA